MRVEPPQLAEHLARLQDTTRLFAPPVCGRQDLPEVFRAAQRRCAVLRLDPKDLLPSLRVDAEHRGRPSVGTDDEIADSQAADRPEAVRGQDAGIQRLRPPAHICQRGHLDRPAFEVAVQPLGIHRVVERVEERAHVGVDFREDVAGEEAEPFPRLDRRAREDEPPDLPLRERRDRERDREVGLAGSGRADPEGDGAVADRVHVALLGDRLRRDPLAAMRPDDVREDLAHVLGLVDRAEDGVDGAGAHLLAALDELDELLDHRLRLGDLQVVAGECEPVAAQVDGAAEPVAERVEHAVADAGELRRNLVRHVENRLHGVSVGGAPGRKGFVL